MSPFIFSLLLLVLLFFEEIVCSNTNVNTRKSYVLSQDGVTVNVTKGDSFLLVCVNPNEWYESTRVIWSKDGEKMNPEDYPRIIFTNLNIQFERVTIKDAGVYECDVKDNVDGELKGLYNRKGTLTVNPRRPKFIEPTDEEEDEISHEIKDRNMSCEYLEFIRNQTLDNLQDPYLCFDLSTKKSRIMTHYLAKPAGSSVTLMCSARGNPKPSIKWYKDNKPFTPFGYQHKITKKGLEIENSNPSDTANYKCEASNDNYTLEYIIEYVVVQRALSSPIFKEGPANVTQVVGSRVELRVKILSDPEYSLIWIKHSRDDPYNYSRVESRTNDEEIKADLHLLVLENVTLDDEGWYSCVAGNSIGRSDAPAYVRVLAEVPQVGPVTTPSDKALTPVTIAAILVCITIIIIAPVWLMYKRVKSQSFQRSLLEAKGKPMSWIKQVRIDRRPVEDNDEQAIMIPEVNIKCIESNKSNQEYDLPTDAAWEFPRDQLDIGKHLGEGAFGEVKLGVADGIVEPGVKTPVAVKTLKKTHTDSEMVDLMSEMEIMKVLGKHKNIINLLGCCTIGGELLVIMEFAEEGNLRDYLRKNRQQFVYENEKLLAQTSPGFVVVPVVDSQSNNNNEGRLTFVNLMSIAYQVARGMEYLVQKKYVHRDLAARNILVCKDKIVKIADFGMTRSTFTNDYYRKKSDGRVPVKWMAPETLFHRIYTTQSDVWSYGVLLWEIVTFGGTPYPSMPDVNKLLDFLKTGRRMEQPPGCPTELYLIMRDCWMDSPSTRPSFADLVDDINRILTIATKKEYVQVDPGSPMTDYVEVQTPESTPENSVQFAMFDAAFIKSFTEQV